uniref:NADP-dependent oxidoreductase domain-containing protein n=1 Tax=Gopherus agassizii TaxID=38772 RepID=A0A452GTV6_9SAUR
SVKEACWNISEGEILPVISSEKSKCEEAVKAAIEVGFRHINGTFVYGTEEEVGQAIREKIADGTVKREDIFYTGKLGSTFHRPELVRSCLEQSLKKLKFDYLDLFIIHIPVSLKVNILCTKYTQENKCLVGWSGVHIVSHSQLIYSNHVG